MRKAWGVAVAVVFVSGVAVALAGDHPRSQTPCIADGCNRSQLALLAEGVANLTDVAHSATFPSWVCVNGDRAPKRIEGTEVATHTAGSDLFGVNKSYDA